MKLKHLECNFSDINLVELVAVYLVPTGAVMCRSVSALSVGAGTD